MQDDLLSPLRLRSGLILGNRIAKAAMEEVGTGGPGLLITGNVMVHAHALTGPGGVGPARCR